MDRPFISFLTDFGLDAAAAICRGVMLSVAPDARIIDISHSVRKYAVRDGAFLLWMSLHWMPIGVHVAVVDPGVGTARRPIAIRTGRGDFLVGPDNGLLMPAAESLGGIVGVRVIENRDWLLPRTSSTFHGRDVFAPVAGHLARGDRFEDAGRPIDPATLVELRFPAPIVGEGRLETTVTYVDSFGNLRLGATPDDLAGAIGELTPGHPIEVELAPQPPSPGGDPAAPIRETAAWARTFGAVPAGSPMLYQDSNGQLAYADSQGNAAARLGVAEDAVVVLRRA
jgi:S-adenosylmethionine hydrolase